MSKHFEDSEPRARLRVFVDGLRGAPAAMVWDVVDALLSILDRLGDEFDDGHEYRLDAYLREAGSVWTLSADQRSLERRVAEEIRGRAEKVLGPADRASHHAKKAWAAVYGRSPNPSEAHHEAVKAVEAAALPIVSPKDATATLGKMLGEIKANRSHWRLAFTTTKLDPVDALISMLGLLWTSQHDRHASHDPHSPVSVTQEQAEAAVHLALTLVHWFRSGVVQRVKP